MRKLIILFLLFSICSFAGDFVADFADNFSNNPVENYKKFQERRRAEGRNFHFPEVKETVDALLEKLRTLLTTYASPSPYANTLKNALDNLNTTANHNYPYASTLVRIKDALDAITYHHESLGHYRNIQLDNIEIEATSKLYSLIENEKVLLIPTTTSLPFRFFSKMQSVRVYPLGVIFDAITIADNRKMTPALFFYHDALHAERNDDVNNKLIPDIETMIRLQANITVILQKLDELKDRKLKETCELLLADCFHEEIPIRCDFSIMRNHFLKTQEDLGHGTMIDIGPLSERIAMKITQGFYGEDAKELAKYTTDAAKIIIDIIEHELN